MTKESDSPPDWYGHLRDIGQEISPDAAEASMSTMSRHLVHQRPTRMHVEHDVAFGPNLQQRMDVYRPWDVPPCGAVVFVHGGGFVAGDKRERPPFYENVGWWAVQHGLVGINVNYRLAPKHAWPAAIDDLDQALQTIRARADEWQIDLERVLLLGHSAGAAHAAGWLARHAESDATLPVARAILISGVYDCATMRLSPGRAAYFGTDVALLQARSPAAQLSRSSVPLTLVVADMDPPELLQQAERLCSHWPEGAASSPTVLRLQWHNHFSTVLQLGAEPSELDGYICGHSRVR